MSNKELFKDAKVGDKVYCLRHGEGRIVEVKSYEHTSPVMVRFNGDLVCTYTFEGFDWSSVNQMLYYTKPEIIEQKRQIEVKMYKVLYRTHSIPSKLLVSLNHYEDRADFENHAIRGNDFIENHCNDFL